MEIIIAIFMGLVVGFVLGWLSKRAPSNRAEIDRLIAEKAAAEAKYKMLNDGVFADRFKSISSELIEKNREEQIKTIDRLKLDFDRQIKEMLESSAKNKTSLEEQLKFMRDSAGALQQQALDLSNALKHKKQQGNWGEFQLERIFEILGFREGIEYNKEVFVRADDGSSVRPDYVLNLPNNRRVIIDSKLSLESYMKYVNSTDDSEKKKFAREFVAATKNHISILGGKEYQNKLKDSQLDYVFMFMPLEHSYLVALEEDPELYQFAFKNNVAMATPSLLLPMMRTVDTLLKIDKRDKNIEEVTEMLNKLYEKYVGFTDNFADVGLRIAAANESYNNALKQLKSGSGNMGGWFEKIRKKSGIISNKQPAITAEESDE